MQPITANGDIKVENIYDFNGKGFMCVTLFKAADYLVVDFRKGTAAVIGLKN